MEQRLSDKRGRDDFPTPPWGTRSVVEHVLGEFIPLGTLKTQIVWDPAAGAGYMSTVLGEYFYRVYESDVHDYAGRYTAKPRSPTRALGSFVLTPDHPKMVMSPPIVDWVITNPPFKLGLDFCLRALKVARVGVAILARTQFKEGADRYQRLFVPHPPTTVAIFSGRLAMVEGRYDPAASTATSYSWFVWLRGHPPTPDTWIPPSAKLRLTREGDSLL